MTDADRDAMACLEFGYAELTRLVTLSDETWSIPWDLVP
jgi:hypothetical protein